MSNPLIPQSTKDGMWQRMSTDPLLSGRISPFDPQLSLPEAPGTGILITPDESERLRGMSRLPGYIPVPVLAGLSGEAPGFEPVHTDPKDLITHTPVPILQGVDILSTPIHEQARQDNVFYKKEVERPVNLPEDFKWDVKPASNKVAPEIYSHGKFGKIYKDPEQKIGNKEIWWSKDTAGHGGASTGQDPSAYKLFIKTKEEFKWLADVTKDGEIIWNKTKGPIGDTIEIKKCHKIK